MSLRFYAESRKYQVSGSDRLLSPPQILETERRVEQVAAALLVPSDPPQSPPSMVSDGFIFVIPFSAPLRKIKYFSPSDPSQLQAL